ncbi:NADH-quinone oxidoreductase subunit J [Achromobacter sp. F4_2707]|uniref:NADH-quinone oxidoreductase subunit J n=1 Tax=Achromobacter sp. F4_2707 TaxID=3114286 RepID=UPI0039C71446
MNFVTVLFYILAIVLVVAAARVVTARSPVTAVLHLILTFFTASMLWMLLGAEFLSLLLVIVYVGAVLVMFLFVVMMLDIRMEDLRAGFKAYLPLGLVIAAIMVLEMAFVLGTTWSAAGPQAARPDDYNNTLALGEAMYTDYIFAVQVGGVILLVGMVAAIALTLRKRTDVKRTDPSKQVRVRAKDRVRMANIQVPKDSGPAGQSAQGEAK